MKLQDPFNTRLREGRKLPVHLSGTGGVLETELHFQDWLEQGWVGVGVGEDPAIEKNMYSHSRPICAPAQFLLADC